VWLTFGSGWIALAVMGAVWAVWTIGPPVIYQGRHFKGRIPGTYLDDIYRATHDSKRELRREWRHRLAPWAPDPFRHKP
jgi:hypothetical protein